MVPGELVVAAPETVPVGTDFSVTWNEVATVTGYRVSFKPEGGFSRYGELAPSVRKYTLNGVSAPGGATLQVSAVTENLGDTEHSAIEVLRVDRRTMTIGDAQTEPEPQIVVSGRGTLSRYHSELVIRVVVDGQPVTNAEVSLGNLVMPASAELGWYELSEYSGGPLFGDTSELRVVYGGKELRRTLVTPGPFRLTSPEPGARPGLDASLLVEWTPSANATAYEVTLVAPYAGSRQASSTGLSTTFAPTGWTGYATLHLHAITVDEPGEGLGRIELHRALERNLLFE